MERFLLMLAIVVFGVFFCQGQMIERDEGILIMKNIFDQNEEILEHLKGQQEKITSLEDMQRTMMLKFQGQQDKLTTLEDMQRTMMLKFQGQQDKLTTLEEMQRTIEDTLRDQHTENQLCAKQDQLEDFKNTYESGTEELKASLELSSCTDQLLDFQEMLAKDECQDRTHKCSPSAHCTDQLILYKCVCLPGYTGDGFYCTDIDECQRGQHQCQSPKICINIDGSYECQCPEGYEVEVNGCRDIDECQRGQHQCQSPKTCINIDGSYECQCTPPYIRDGESCKIDCESPSLFLDGLGCITLIETGMTWTEARAECKRLGLRLLEDLKVEHLSPLDLHFTPLRKGYRQQDNFTNLEGEDLWIGFRDKFWLTSGHSVASDLVAVTEGELEGGECGTFDFSRNSYFGLWDVPCTRTYDSLCQTIP